MQNAGRIGRVADRKLSSQSIGIVSVLLGIVVFALTLWVLFAPPPIVALPTIIIGVGAMVSALVVAVAIIMAK